MRRCVTVFKSSLEDLKQLTFFSYYSPKHIPERWLPQKWQNRYIRYVQGLPYLLRLKIATTAKLYYARFLYTW